MASVDTSLQESECACLTCRSCVAFDSPLSKKRSEFLLKLAHLAKETLDNGESIVKLLDCYDWYGRPFQESEVRMDKDMSEAKLIPCREIRLRKDTRRELTYGVYIFDTEDGDKVVVKTDLKRREALIHREVELAASQWDSLRGMVVRHLSTETTKWSASVTMEFVRGINLFDSWMGLSAPVRRDTLLVLHHLMGRLYEEIGFTHGDLSAANVVLREGKRSWSFDVGGSYITITLPFSPTLIDFEYSCTRSRAYFDRFSSPYRNEGADIIRLYAQLVSYFDITQEPLVTIKKYFAPILGTGAFGGTGDNQLVPVPIPLLHSSLTHKALMEVLVSIE